jgi:hypothetical protein
MTFSAAAKTVSAVISAAQPSRRAFACRWLSTNGSPGYCAARAFGDLLAQVFSEAALAAEREEHSAVP